MTQQASFACWSAVRSVLFVFICRVIISKTYYEPYEILPEAAIEAAVSLLLQLKMPRHNEGMMTPSEFPVNYFTIAEVEQWWPEEFAATFMHVTGKNLKSGDSYFWRYAANGISELSRPCKMVHYDLDDVDHEHMYHENFEN